jgi:glucose-1-phosphate thymidylyltransferase
VKAAHPATHWVWGGFKLTGWILADLHALWRERNEEDAYVGTLVNAWIARGGEARAVPAGEAYVDVGTLHGYHEALQLLRERVPEPPSLGSPEAP